MKKILLALALLLSVSGFAQMTGWQYALPITITNNSGTPGVDFTVDITVNTAQYVTAGQMLATGNDIRFGTNCGATLYSYYINSGMNTANTSITVKIPALGGNATHTFYMFYGNAAAPSATTIAAFSGPFSSVNQFNPTTYNSGGFIQCQRGFRFAPNSDILVTSFGKNEPSGTTRYVTLFNFTTQAIIQQNQVSGPAAAYSYQQLTSPIWLTAGTQYLIEIYGLASDGYYFGAPGTVTNSNLTYYDMRYCNSCTQNTFPTNSLGNMHYGYVDFQFYLKAPLSPLPTVTFGTIKGLASATIASNVGTTICPGQSATFTATTPNSYPYYGWQKNGGPVGTNINNYTENTIVAGDAFTVTVLDSGLCIPATSNTIVMSIHPTPTAVVTSVDPSVCIGSSTVINIALTGPAPFNFNYFNGVSNTTQPAHNSNTFAFSASPSVPTTYYVNSILDGNNCAATIAGLQDSATVTVDDSALITSDPVDASGCSNTPVTFSVAATGSGLGYQWYNGATALSNGINYTGVGTNTLTVNNTTGMNGMEYHAVVSSICGINKYSDTVALTELTTNTWTGATNNFWSVPTNWDCGAVPIVTTNVIIPNVANDPIVDIPGAICNSITLNAGASLMFNGTNNALEVKTNIANNGTFDASLGKLILSGTVLQNVPGVTYKNLDIMGGSTKTLDGDVTVTEILNLNNGKLDLGNNDLILDMPVAQMGGNANSYAITNGTGMVIGRNMGTGGNPDAVTFHVGINSASYTPVTLENTGDADTFSVWVMEHVYEDGTGTNPAQVDNPVVDRTWMISENTPGGSFATITPQWNAGDGVNGFSLLHTYVTHFMGGEWTSEIDSAIYAAPANGLNPYTAMEDSITSFSPFAVASYGQFPLAIRLSTISAANSSTRNKVEWKSAKEDDGDKYELEHSTDAKAFNRIATVTAKGKASTYTQWHENAPKGINYYRLKMIDADGKYNYSKVVSATVKGADNFNIEAFPNPVKNIVSVQLNGAIKGKGSVTITDVTGRVVKSAIQVTSNKTDINVSELSSGVYLINYTDDARTESVKINKQ